MKRIILLACLLVTGCRTYQCGNAKPTDKWIAEGSLGTAVYPNAPYDSHDYLIEKIDIGIKLKREW